MKNNDLSNDLKDFSDNIEKVNKLNVDIIHKTIIKENLLLIKEIELKLKDPTISEKQRWYSEQILKNLK